MSVTSFAMHTEPFSFRFFVVFVEEVAIRRVLLQQALEHSEISPKGELNASAMHRANLWFYFWFIHISPLQDLGEFL